MARVLRHRRQRRDRHGAVARLRGARRRGRRRWRDPMQAALALQAAGATAVRGDALDEGALRRGMRRLRARLTTLQGSTRCAWRIPRPMQLLNARRSGRGDPRSSGAQGCARFIHTSSAATIGEPPGSIGTERRSTAAGTCRPMSAPRPKASALRFAPRASSASISFASIPRRCQGPGRAGGTARFLLAFLDGRLKVFVQRNISLVDIADCVEGSPACGRARRQRRALSAQRDRADDEPRRSPSRARSPACAPSRGCCRAPVATVAAGVVETAFKLARRKPPVCREMVRTLLHGHSYDGSRAERELGLRYTEPRETIRRTVEWARSEGLLRPAPAERHTRARSRLAAPFLHRSLRTTTHASACRTPMNRRTSRPTIAIKRITTPKAKSVEQMQPHRYDARVLIIGGGATRRCACA